MWDMVENVGRLKPNVGRLRVPELEGNVTEHCGSVLVIPLRFSMKFAKVLYTIMGHS